MSFGEGVLQGLDMYQKFSANRRANERNDASLKIAREQQDINNYAFQKTQIQDEAKNVVGAIDELLGNEGMGSATNKPWERVNAERPELVAKLANNVPGFRDFTDENGQNVTAEVVSFEKETDPATGETYYVPMVKRNDNEEIVPMTEGRSARAEDPIVRLSEDDFKQQIESRWQQAIIDGGKKNELSSIRGREAALNAEKEGILRDNDLAVMSREAILAAVGQDGTITPEAKTEFAGLINSINDPQELMKIAEKQGIDIASLSQAAEQRSDEELAATAPEGSLEALLYENGVTRKIWDSSDDDQKKLIVERLNQAQGSEKVMDILSLPWAQAKDAVLQPWDSVVNLGNDFAESRAGRFLGLSEVTDKPAPDQVTNNVDDKFRAIREQETPRTAEDIDSSFSSSPPFEVSAETLRAAIIDGTQKPTDRQKTEMVSFLKEKGVTTMADLEKAILDDKIKDSDAKMIAFVAAMSHDGSDKEKDAVAQGLMNLIARGETDLSKTGQATLDYNASAARTARYSAETERQQLVFDMEKYDDGATPAAVTASTELFDKIATMSGLMEDGEFTPDGEFDADGDDAKAMGREISKFMGIAALNNLGPNSLNAYLAGMKPSVGLYVQALANDDGNDFFSTENFMDFFRPDASGTTSFDLRELRVGSVRNGRTQTINYVGPDGVVSQSVSLADIQRNAPLLARIIKTAAEANSKASK